MQDNIFRLVPSYFPFSVAIKASIYSHIPEIYFISRFIVCKLALLMNIVKNYPFSINSCFCLSNVQISPLNIFLGERRLFVLLPRLQGTPPVRENIHSSPNGNSLKTDILCTCRHLLPRHPRVQCCDVRYDFRVTTMFGTFSHAVASSRAHV